MGRAYPVVGQWFRHPGGQLFEIVAVDEEDCTIEIQQFDGTIDELEFEQWTNMLLFESSGPDDWSGSVDMDSDDFAAADAMDMPEGFHDPLEIIDKL